MQSNIQVRGVKHTSLASVLLRDEESDALHKINYYIYKDTEYKYVDVKICPRSCLLFVFGQVMKAILVNFRHEWSAVSGLIREQFPPITTPARAREPVPLRWKHNYRLVDLLVNYVCLMFNLYF